MTDQGQAPAPKRGFPWAKTLLVISLAANLLIAGAAAARYFVHEPPGRAVGISHQQIIPRRFFADLDRDRRKELMAVFKDFRGKVKEGREDTKKISAELAAALEASPYDEAKVMAAVDAFAGRSAALMQAGAGMAIDFIARLTPEERILLAKHIRQRAEYGKEKD